MKSLEIFFISLLITFFTACSSDGTSSTTSDTTLQSSTIFKASFAPSQNSIAKNASIILEFSQALDESTLNSENIYLKNSDGNKITAKITIEDSNIKIIPSTQLKLNATYILIVTTDVKNVDGISLEQDYKWEFIVTSTDTTAPKLKSTLPALNSNYADITTSIILEFDELLDTTNIQEGTLELKDSSNNLVNGRFDYSNQWLVFFPSTNLSENETYTLNITKDIYDLSSNIYDGNTSFSFTTSSTVLNSDGFSKFSTDLALASESYSMLVLDDTTLFIGSKDKISKVSTTRDNGVPNITLESSKESSDFGTIYDIKTLSVQGSCSTYDNLVLATSEGISIVDTSDLSIKSSFTIDKSSFGVDVVCNTSSKIYAYVASSNNGVTILDITDATSIKKIDSFETVGITFDVISKYEKIYTASYSDGVNVYDNSGLLLQHFASNSTARALEIDGNELIVSDGITGIKKFNISTEGVLSESTATQSLSSIIDSYSTADNIFAITISKGISVIDKSNPLNIAYQIPSTNRFISAGTDSEFLYTLSLDGIISAYNLDSTEISGQAIDGYLSGATVFKDCNNNKFLDIGIDIQTIADANGSYSFTNIPYSCKNANLIAQGGIDVDTGIEFTGILIAKSGSKNITPLTTLVEADPTLEATLLSELGISSIDGDFVKAKNPQAMKLALAITNTLSNISNNFSVEKATITIQKIAHELKTNPSSITDEALMSDSIAQAAADTFDEIVVTNPDIALFLPSTNDYKNSVNDLIDAFNGSVDADGKVDKSKVSENIIYSETITMQEDDERYGVPVFTLKEDTNVTISIAAGADVYVEFCDITYNECINSITAKRTSPALKDLGKGIIPPPIKDLGKGIIPPPIQNSENGIILPAGEYYFYAEANDEDIINQKVSVISHSNNIDTEIYSTILNIEAYEGHEKPLFVLDEETVIVLSTTGFNDADIYIEGEDDWIGVGSKNGNNYLEKILPPGEYYMEIYAYADIQNANISISKKATIPILSPDVVLTKDITIEGNFIQRDSSIDLNNHKLIIKGDYTQVGTASINIGSNNGSLEVFKNYILLNESRLIMGSDNIGEQVIVHKNLNIDSSGENTLRGTMSLYGDFIHKNNTTDPNVNNFKLILKGSKKQTISFDKPEDVALNILEITNTSTNGVDFSTKTLVLDEYINNNTPIINSSNLKIGLNAVGLNGVINQDFILDEKTHLNKNMIINGNLYHNANTLSLLGYNLTVNGDYIQTGDSILNISDSILEVKGDFKVHSNLTNNLSSGMLKLYGNFSQQGNDSNFQASEEFTTILTGHEKQIISFESPIDLNSFFSNGSSFSILDIRNTSSQGVEFLTNTVITDDFIPNTSTIVNGSNLDMSVNVALASGIVYGDVNIEQILVLYSDLRIDGNFRNLSGKVELNGNTLSVGGNFTLEDDSYLKMSNFSDKLEVYGDLSINTNNSNSILSNGTIYLHGNFSQQNNDINFHTGDSFKTILIGDTKQTISFEDPFSSNFNFLDINNTSNEGVEFLTTTVISEDFNTNNKAIINKSNIYLHGISSAINGIINYNIYMDSSTTLNEDLVINGNIYHNAIIYHGYCNINNLDLNGFTLTIDGNYTQSNLAQLSFNNGTFEVQGDYNSTTTCIEMYSMNMRDYKDKLEVHGNLNLHSNMGNDLTRGTIYLNGNLSVTNSSWNFKAGDEHKTALNGDTKQTVYFESGNDSNFGVLDIDNSSNNGVEFLSVATVNSDYYKNANSAVSGLTLSVNGTSYSYEYWDLTIDLSNIYFSEYDITKIYLKDSLYGEKLLTDSVIQDNNLFSNAITDVHNYSLMVKLADNSIWWYNFNEGMFYTSDDGSANFDINTTSDLIITPNNNWE